MADVPYRDRVLKLLELSPEDLGRAVQNSWARQAQEMPNAPDAWKRTWDEVSPGMKEIDIKIGLDVASLILETMKDSDYAVMKTR